MEQILGQLNLETNDIVTKSSHMWASVVIIFHPLLTSSSRKGGIGIMCDIATTDGWISQQYGDY